MEMWKAYRAVVAGSGSAAFSEPFVCDLVISAMRRARAAREEAVGKSPDTGGKLRVAYIGTATYDAVAARTAQTGQLEQRGCEIVDISVTWPSETPAARLEHERREVLSCDAVLVSGGNTLYALQRWRECGLDNVLREAADAGLVLAGGSAGAICWFDGGHSDSADPASFRKPRDSDGGGSAETAAPVSTEWKYIRVSALGLFPGLICPHHDRTQSNGSPRYFDFDAMLLRHSGERGIGIDHWCAVVIENGEYSLYAVPGKPGSVLYPTIIGDDDDAEKRREPMFVTDGSGVPGVWVKDVKGVASHVEVVQTAAARRGPLSLLLRPATSIEAETASEQETMLRNPTAE
jgi:dipeptidase E